ncbi:MAG: hypothetical protein ACR2RL_05175 [Gammaproteobacteria bacterium]
MAKQTKKAQVADSSGLGSPQEEPLRFTPPVVFYATLMHEGNPVRHRFQPNHTYTVVPDDQAEHAVSGPRKELSQSAFEELQAQIPE